MASFLIPEPDEDKTATLLRLAIKANYPKEKDATLRSFLNFLTYGCSYGEAMDKKFETMKTNLPKLDLDIIPPETFVLQADAIKELNRLISPDPYLVPPPSGLAEGIVESPVEDETPDGEEPEEPEETTEEEPKTKPKRKLAEPKKIKPVKKHTLTWIEGPNITYSEVLDPEALQSEIDKAAKVESFRLRTIHYIYNERLRALKDKKLTDLLNEAQKWFTRTFYTNVAGGNIVDFVINDFVTPELSDEETSKLLSEAEEPADVGIYASMPAEVIRLEYGSTKLDVSKAFVDLSESAYQGPKESKNESIFILGLRYNAIGFADVDDNYVAIPDEVSQLFDLELFGSPFNTVGPYFSPFPEVEEAFGSQGDFFITPVDKTYKKLIFNPPHDADFIQLAVDRLFEDALAANRTVVCVLPVWDPDLRKSLQLPLFTVENKPTIDVKNARRFEAYDTIRGSPLLRNEWIVDERHPLMFTDFRTGENVNLGPLCVMILSRGPATITREQLEEVWPRDE